MQNPVTFPEPIECDLENPNPFHVLIAYEDLATGKYAKETYDRLRHQLPELENAEIKLWKFDLLRVPKLREIAAADAVTSDMIILSVRDEGELPPDVQGWMEMWLARKGKTPGALVALLNRENQPPQSISPIHLYLQGVAIRAQMDLFVRAADSTRPLPVLSLEALPSRARQSSSVLDGILNQPRPFARAHL